MDRKRNPNLDILELAVARLGRLADEMVFLGGCATGLLLTDSAAPPVRATMDVDVITEVASLSGYHRLAQRLREYGFREDQSDGAPICRWTAEGVVLDVMPTDAGILGFGNAWYQMAHDSAVTVELPSGKRIRMVTAPGFLATKLAAFDDRGGGDYVLSHNVEDIVAVLDGRTEIVDEVSGTDGGLRAHLAARFSELLGDRRFLDALPGHLPGDAASQARLPLIEERMRRIARLG